MNRVPPLRYFLYVLPTIWLILAAVLLLGSLAFSSIGLAVILPIMVVGTVAGIVAVFTQM
jgi:hypothetical protein